MSCLQLWIFDWALARAVVSELPVLWHHWASRKNSTFGATKEVRNKFVLSAETP